VTNGVLAQLDDIERRLSSLQTEVQELRATLRAPERPAPEPPPIPPVPAAASQRAARPAAEPSPPPPSTPREPRPWERELTLPQVELADVSKVLYPR